METVDDVVVAPPCHINNDISPVAKRKRTKRHTPHSSIPFTVNHRFSPTFSTAAPDSTTTEEEDTARCLILLSRGHSLHNNDHLIDSFKQNNRRPPAAAADRGGMYACKTCNRVFSSFQALGGHRTSHKKPKNDKKGQLFPDFDDEFASPSSSKKKMNPPSLALQLSSGGRQRIHECSYCGAEFSSGQALGGHMRRHRAGPTSPLPSPGLEIKTKKACNGLSLDLNFPAPEDENQGCEKNPGKLVISGATPTLVDCHY